MLGTKLLLRQEQNLQVLCIHIAMSFRMQRWQLPKLGGMTDIFEHGNYDPECIRAQPFVRLLVNYTTYEGMKWKHRHLECQNSIVMVQKQNIARGLKGAQLVRRWHCHTRSVVGVGVGVPQEPNPMSSYARLRLCCECSKYWINWCGKDWHQKYLVENKTLSISSLAGMTRHRVIKKSIPNGTRRLQIMATVTVDNNKKYLLGTWIDSIGKVMQHEQGLDLVQY